MITGILYKMNSLFDEVLGIDVSKEWLDVSLCQKVSRVEQSEESLNAFIETCVKPDKRYLVVVESTGGYERLAVECFAKANVQVHVAHPNRVKAYARARGYLAKTDQIDARVLEGYGRFLDPKILRPLPSEQERKLKALNTRLVQLKESHHQECCRLGTERDPEVRHSHKSLIQFLMDQIKQIEAQLLKLIKDDPILNQRFHLLCSMKGVGPVLAMTILSDLPELGHMNKKEVAALVGVAPFLKESGKKSGRALTQCGRHSVRKVLYMAALVAAHHNKRLKEFYNHLLARGKPKKVALVAVMRKMIIILNAMVQTNSAYNA